MKTNNRAVYGLRAKKRGLIYEGSHHSFKDALHHAIEMKTDLTGVNLSYQDLQAVNLDGVNLTDVNFSHCDLSGANISEAIIKGCDFSNASLFDACFCYSDILSSSFMDARFGMTDFSEAKIISCIFSGASSFTNNFSVTHEMSDNSFRHGNETLRMTKPPKVVLGFKQTIALLDGKAMIGADAFDMDPPDKTLREIQAYADLLARIST